MNKSAIPETMPAMVLTGHGDFDQLIFHPDWPVPAPGPDQVLIKVEACGLNNTDVNTRTAWYSKAVTDATTGGAFDTTDDDDSSWGGAAITFPRIQGADVAGTVVALGSGADSSLLAKRVLVDTWVRDPDDPDNRDKVGYFGSECDGGFAAYVATHQSQVHPVNSTLASAELATFATACITAENMLNRAAVTKGDTVLIPGASGGVGSALVQLARRRGATAIALCAAGKHKQMAATGADVLLDRNPTNLARALKDSIGQSSVSVVADVVGGSLWPQVLDVLQPGGRYTCAGAIAGPMVEFDLRTFYLRDLTMTGATVVPRGVFTDLVGYIERGEIAPLLAATYPLAELHQAQRAFIAKKHVGNIVVIP